MRRLLMTAVVLAVLATTLAAPVATAAPVRPGPAVGNRSHGLTVTSVDALTARTTVYRVATTNLRQPVRIVVTLPQDYDRRRRYPVLYLMHGTGGNPTDWVLKARAEESTAKRDVIVVAPDAGYEGDGGGWFVNWWNGGRGGVPRWEDFHIDQVVPWVDAQFPTIATRQGRAVAGASQGGFGAMHAAARHPDMFATVGSFSGAATIYRDPHTRLYAGSIIELTTLLLDGAPPLSMFGDPFTNAVHWEGHDPGWLVDNLRHTTIDLSTGNGLPGARDDLTTCCTIASNLIEHAAHTSTHAFARFADEAGVRYRLISRVGTHSWPYWQDDVQRFTDLAMKQFRAPAARPAQISYTSIERRWTQWGWTVEWDRRAKEQGSTLSRAGSRGFRIAGEGTARVVTPRSYRPRSTHVVTVTSGTKAVRTSVRADASGRLAIRVPVAAGQTAAVAIR